ncbi:DJ-1/PfpI family protein [Mycoplasma enhydrae]|uniref:DJ-1/PfpI family protein n=1 Tax=Mycoplasma enhydrae TaxID=2499220 RepID=UPI00197BE03A|nr:DJ-1/PfpI family protein [Mycoplasma enhydrae]MBN4089295.1 DJ-1/PfpI family protein [Mycoplasma enhydrae]MCV3733545.1 DJ-1/PfpI family protein [Mycoplasma enhydrae]MCV3753479.1 DJ-1/PfpI family protein [Mycoplasma enhydrae]
MKLLILAHNGFNDIELGTTYSIFNYFKHFEKITIFNPDLNTKEVIGQGNVLKLSCENQVNLDEYDAIFIPGGSGAQTLRKDKESLDIIRQFKNSDKYIFAICDAPNVLYENNIIDDSINYSSYPISSNFKEGLKRNKNDVTVDKKIVTGRCPSASLEFALEILKLLFDADEVNHFIKYLKADLE